jgi:hypothetical protein
VTDSQYAAVGSTVFLVIDVMLVCLFFPAMAAVLGRKSAAGSAGWFFLTFGACLVCDLIFSLLIVPFVGTFSVVLAGIFMCVLSAKRAAMRSQAVAWRLGAKS